VSNIGLGSAGVRGFLIDDMSSVLA